MSRRIDLSKFRGESDDDDGDFSGPPPKVAPVQLDSLKQQTFSQGVHKKTKRDIERENEERKRKQEEIDNAKAIAEYEAEFSGYDRSSSSSSRGMPPRGPRGGGFVRAAGDGGSSSGAYMPSRQLPSGPAAMRGAASSSSSMFSRPGAPPTHDAKEEGRSSKPAKGAPRAMDSFLDEIKKEQQYREQKYGHVAKQEGTSISALAAWERQRGSHDIGDMETTNIFVSNMPAGVSEDSLGMFFAKYGPVGTVKIMWPRGESDFAAATAHGGRPKAGLSGFVAYMKRRDAEAAVKELDGFDWGGSVLRVGWGKMVRLPPRPLYELKRGRSRSRSPRGRRSSPSPDARRSRSASRSKRRRHDSHESGLSDCRSPSRSRSPPRRQSRHALLMDKLLSRIDQDTERFVRACAEKVVQHGRDFEDMLRTREARNPKFAFLREDQLPEYQLYRTIVDRNYRLPSPPPDEFGDEGKAALDSEDSAEESENDRCKKGAIGKLARRRFENGLRCVRGNREEIARLMEFAVVHADAYEEVADILCKSLCIASTPIPRKIARLHLVSDILHNSAAPLPNVWQYPRAFESRLKSVVDHFSQVHSALVAQNGRLSAEAFKDQVLFVLGVWESWLVFTPATLDVLRRALHGEGTTTAADKAAESAAAAASPTTPAATESKFKKSSGFKSIALVAAAPPPPPGPALEEQDDLDGEAMDGDDNDDNLDGEAIDDLDGQPIADGEDDEDLDGEVMS